MSSRSQSDGATTTHRVDCSDGLQQYEFEYQTAGSDAPPRMSVLLTELATGTKHELSAAQVLKGEVPEAFRAMHKEVMDQVKQWIPSKHLGLVSGQPESSGEPPANAATQGEAAEGWKRYVLNREGEPNLRFEGKLVDEMRTPDVRGRWTEMRVYRTKGGKFVGVILGRTIWYAEKERVKTAVADSLAELAPFFGHSLLAKMFTERLGVQAYEDVA